MAVDRAYLICAAGLIWLSTSTGALAMSGACYLDRAPGGCFERATARERAESQEKEQYRDFLSSMTGTPTQQTDPTSNVPAICAVAPNPNNRNATMSPAENLSQDQIKACTSAANEWWAKRRASQGREAQEFLKTARWKEVVATNGMAYQVDVAHIRKLTNGNVAINVVPVANGNFNVMDIEQLIFDCQGNYHVASGRTSGSQYAPPQSVVGLISAIACGQRKN